jgi:glutamate decarboxylase
MYLSDKISKLGPFELITDGSELPVFAFSLKDGTGNYTVFDVSERLRDRGWLVPAYSFPENREDLDALRVVVKNGFSRDLADLLVADLQRHVAYLEQLKTPLPPSGGAGFHH